MNADGNAGDIFITSPSIVVENSGPIGARTYTDGQGGDITIETDRITMLSGGQISTDSDGSSFYRGPAGNVTVSATEGVILSGNSGELNSGFTSATRSGAGAGRITVTTPFLRIVDGGNIRVATGVFGEGSAGEIIISAGRIEILSGGGISSSSSGYGEEGFISIQADGEVRIDSLKVGTSLITPVNRALLVTIRGDGSS